MAELQVPIAPGTALIFIGVAVMIASIVSLITFSPFTGGTFETTRYLLSWLFLIFGFVFVVMGIQRVKPGRKG